MPIAEREIRDGELSPKLQGKIADVLIDICLKPLNLKTLGERADVDYKSERKGKRRKRSLHIQSRNEAEQVDFHFGSESTGRGIETGIFRFSITGEKMDIWPSTAETAGEMLAHLEFLLLRVG